MMFFNRRISFILFVIMCFVCNISAQDIEVLFDINKSNKNIDSIEVSRFLYDRENSLQKDFIILTEDNSWSSSFIDGELDLYTIKAFRNGANYLETSVWMMGPLAVFAIKKNEIIFKSDNKGKVKVDSINLSLSQAGQYGVNAVYYKMISLIDSNKGNSYSAYLLEYMITLFPNDMDKQLAGYQIIQGQSEKLKVIPKVRSIHNYFNKLVTSINQVQGYRFDKLNSESVKNYSLLDVVLIDVDYTVIDFWFIGCPPCLSDHKMMAVENPGNVVGVTDEELIDVEDYNKEHNIKWGNYSLKNGELGEDIGILSFPTYWIIDKEGVIKYRAKSWEEVKMILIGLRTIDKYRIKN